MYCGGLDWTNFNRRRGGGDGVDIGFGNGNDCTWRAWTKQRKCSEEAAWLMMVLDPAEERARGAVRRWKELAPAAWIALYQSCKGAGAQWDARS